MGDIEVSPHIVAFYGDYQHKGDLNLVLERVDNFSLEMMYEQPPPEVTEMLSFWTSFVGVFKPLSRLHGMRRGGTIFGA
jgi:hypothetical protein